MHYYSARLLLFTNILSEMVVLLHELLVGIVPSVVSPGETTYILGTGMCHQKGYQFSQSLYQVCQDRLHFRQATLNGILNQV